MLKLVVGKLQPLLFLFSRDFLKIPMEFLLSLSLPPGLVLYVYCIDTSLMSGFPNCSVETDKMGGSTIISSPTPKCINSDDVECRITNWVWDTIVDESLAYTVTSVLE